MGVSGQFALMRLTVSYPPPPPFFLWSGGGVFFLGGGGYVRPQGGLLLITYAILHAILTPPQTPHPISL